MMTEASKGMRLLRHIAIFAVAVAAALSFAPVANAQCATNLAGTVVTCTGDASQGVSVVGPPAVELDVQSLTQSINPSAGVAGIAFVNTTSGDEITVNVDTRGTAGIFTSLGAPGIQALAAVADPFGSVTSGNVSVTNAGSIQTVDASSYGIFASTVALGDPSAKTGALTVINSGAISTSGAGADGILAHSQALGVAFAQTGSVSIANFGTISTSGNGAAGISASSEADACNCSGTAATGSVTVTNYGAISTSGFFAPGIHVASTAFGHIGNEVSGPVTITNYGNITTGPNSPAIFVEADEAGAVTINNVAGIVNGGVGAIGGNFVLNNAARLMTPDGVNGVAVGAASGVSATVNNTGTLTGLVDLENDTNAFNNLAGAQFNMGSDVILLHGGTLTNAGTMSPGGTGVVFPTFITGNVVQRSTGTYATDVDLLGGQADFIDISRAARLAGSVAVTVDSLKAGPQSFTILSAANGVTNNGLALVASPALQAQLLFPNPSDVVLATDLDFAPQGAGLNANQTAIAKTLETAFLAGGGGLSSALLGLANTPGNAGYQNALDQLSPEVYNLALIEALYGSQQFANDMLSCRVTGDDGAAFIREGQCVWARARARFLDIDHTGSHAGSDDATGSFSAGGQVAVAPDWRFGFAAGYDRVNVETSTSAISNGDRANVGSIVKYNPGALLLAAGVTAGWGTYDTTRTISFGGFNATATSGNTIDYVAGQLHAAYLVDRGGWYVKPLVDAAITELRLDNFVESGGGGAALGVAGKSDTVVSVSPALEVGTEMRIDALSVWRPFIRVGATWQDRGSLGLSAGFLDAPPGVSSFVIGTKLDRVLADVSTGVDVINTSGAVMRLQYDGRFGESTKQNGVSVKGSVPY